MIVGAKGGRLDLLLNTVYYLSQPIEKIPWTYYKEFLPPAKRKDGKDGKFRSMWRSAIPVCLGDMVGPKNRASIAWSARTTGRRGSIKLRFGAGKYRVRATSPAMFTELLQSKFQRERVHHRIRRRSSAAIWPSSLNLRVGDRM